MPKAVDDCVEKLLAKWKADPASRPRPKKKDQDEKSQAWAICNAAAKKATEASTDIMFDDDSGYGPTLVGAAATNRPYIPMLQESKILEREDGSKVALVHLAIPGYFNHPTGAFVLNRAVFSSFIANFSSNVVGQKLCYDARHKPELGALGWFDRLFLAECENLPGVQGLFAEVDPTDVGLAEIENRRFLYSSMTFHRNYSRDDVKLDLERAEVLEIPLEVEDVIEEEGDEDMGDENKIAELEQKLADLENEKGQLATQLESLEDLQKEHERLRLQARKSSADAVVMLAKSHRDSDGNAHPKALIEWVSKLLKLEKFGKDDGIVQLSQDEPLPDGVYDYLVAAARDLVESLPGVVPLERKTSSGKEDEDDANEYDFAKEWED